MSDVATTRPTPNRVRPGENMRLFEALQYRLPLAGIVSILHRLSGLLMVVFLPLLVWLFDRSVTSEVSYDQFRAAMMAGMGPFGAVLLKLVLLALIWAILFHAIAGVRHLWMDATHMVGKAFGRQTALVVLLSSGALTVLLGLRLFGVF